MLSGKFRPWGELAWVLKRLTIPRWTLASCLSTEDRCVTTFDILKRENYLSSGHFFEIIDPVDGQEHSNKRDHNRDAIKKIGGTIIPNFKKVDLLQEDVKIFNNIQEILQNTTSNLIIDISCLPKRYFFPLVKIALNETRIINLIVTYTSPEKYCDGDLSDDPEPWYPLPLFMPTAFPEEKYDLAIVGTGFMPFSLPKLLKDKHSEIDLKLLFPFPPGPPNYQRTWEFVRKIEKHYTLKEQDRIIRVNWLDVCESFNHICSATDSGAAKTIFAPYGPKPISLAMCLYASLTNSPVYYTQPKFYSPNYSVGSKNCYGYCIKLNSKELYSIN